MTTAQAPGFEYGRATMSTPTPVLVERDLSDPKVVRAIIAEATKVSRAEQLKRLRLRRTRRRFF